MSIKYILYNPLSGNGKGEELSKKLTEVYKDDELKYCNMTQMSGYGKFFDSISSESDIIILTALSTTARAIPMTIRCISMLQEAETTLCVTSARSRAVSR